MRLKKGGATGYGKASFFLFTVCLLVGFFVGWQVISIDKILNVLSMDIPHLVNCLYYDKGLDDIYVKKIFVSQLPVSSRAYALDGESGVSVENMLALNGTFFAENIVDSQTVTENSPTSESNKVISTTAEPEIFYPEDNLKVPFADSQYNDGKQLKKDKKSPRIGIYCTHNAENYYEKNGNLKEEGLNSGVYQVALELQQQLEKKGIVSIVSDQIHDYPDWNLSYQNSLKTMEAMKKNNPSLEFFIDVHRDAIPDGATTVTKINNEKVAKVMLIVGSNKRSNHPNWQQNLAFAQNIGDVMEQMYPGVLRGVRVQNGRYNQHYLPHNILVEMGSTNNTLNEAKKSAAMLAEVLSVLIS